MKILWLGMLTMLSASPALAFRVWPSSLWISKRTLLLGSAERNPIESMDVAEENTPENRFGLQMGAGVDLIVNGNFKEASETIKIALEEFDQNSISLEARAEAMCHMGGALVGLGATEEALECFKKAFQLDPSLNEVADVHNNIAVAFETINLPKMASSEYKAAIKAEPWRPEVRAHYADLLYKTGDVAAAVLELEEAVSLCKDLDSESKMLLLPGLYSALGSWRMDLGWSSKALEAHKEAARLAPGEARYLAMYAKSLAMHDSKEEAARIQALAEAAEVREQARAKGLHMHPPATSPDYSHVFEDEEIEEELQEVKSKMPQKASNDWIDE